MSDDDRRQEVLMAEDAILQLSVELDEIQSLRHLSESGAIQLAEARAIVKQSETSLNVAREKIDAARLRLDVLDEYVRSELTKMNTRVTELDDNFVKEMDIVASRVNQLTVRVEKQIGTLNENLDSALTSHRTELTQHIEVQNSQVKTDINGVQESITQTTNSMLSRIGALETKQASALSGLENRVTQGDQAILSSVEQVHPRLEMMQAAGAELRKLVVYSLVLGGATLLGIVIAIVLILI